MFQPLQYIKVEMNTTQKSSQSNKISSKLVPIDSFDSIDIQPTIPLNVNVMDSVDYT